MRLGNFLNIVNIELFAGKMTPNQRSGITSLLHSFDMYMIKDIRFRSYMLATVLHETAKKMEPIEEYGKGAGKPYGRKIKFSGESYDTPDKVYYGRGYVQLTWYENYEKMGRLLNLPLLEEPEMLLIPEISSRVLIEGMTKGRSGRGDFTGVSLETYFNGTKEDTINARRIINGLDKAELIANYYYKFKKAME